MEVSTTPSLEADEMLSNNKSMIATLYFDFIADHRGMFSRLGLPPEQVQSLRDDHAIYVVGDSRINIAGLAGGRHEPFAAAVAAVMAG